MRVLGIDCGIERTGYGVIDTDGRRHQLIACGVIRTAARDTLQTTTAPSCIDRSIDRDTA